MRLKLFRARDTSSALALVRLTLGPEALILDTRRVKDGVEVTAALEVDGGWDETVLVAPAISAESETEVEIDADDLDGGRAVRRARPKASTAGAADIDPTIDARGAVTRTLRPWTPNSTRSDRRPDDVRVAKTGWGTALIPVPPGAPGRAGSGHSRPSSQAPSGGSRRALTPHATMPAGSAALRAQAARVRGETAPAARVIYATDDACRPAPPRDSPGSDRAEAGRSEDDSSGPLSGRLARPGPTPEPAIPQSPDGHSSARGGSPIALDGSPLCSRRGGSDGALDRALMFRRHGIPPGLAARLESGALPFTLSVALRFAPLQFGDTSDPLVVAGPAGAGKTFTVARLATRLLLTGVRPMVVTADGHRTGAIEQLAAFTRLLGLDLIVADGPDLVARTLSRRRERQPVLIDLPGLDARAASSRHALGEMLAAARGAQALALPAGLDPMEATEIAQAHVEIADAAGDGAGHARACRAQLVATRLDMVWRLGGVLAAAAVPGVALAEAGIGPAVADGLVTLTPSLLAERLMGVERVSP